MPDVNIITVTINGDIGGAGMSRFAVQNAGGTAMDATEGGAAADAIFDMYSTIQALLLGNTYAISNVMQVLDVASGALVAEVGIVPTTDSLVGSGTRSAPAGTGARGYWHTSTVKGRRFVRGATFFTPFTADAYAGNNGLSGGTITTVNTAMNNYLAGMVDATLVPVIWCRPTHALPASGIVAPIIGHTVSNTPCALRSRRT